MIRCSTFLVSLLLVACQPSDQVSPQSDTVSTARPQPDSSLCDLVPTPISQIQGSGAVSPLLGRALATHGVVTLVQPGTGIYLQSEQPEAPLNASQAVFLASGELATSSDEGDLLAASGIVREIGNGPDTLTALSEVDRFAICDRGRDVSHTDAALPMSPDEREALEAMKVILGQPLTISDVYGVAGGAVTLSALGVPVAPTEAALPGEGAIAVLEEIQNGSLRVHHESLSRLEPLDRAHVGAQLSGVGGVMGNIDGQQTLMASHPLEPVAQPGNAPEASHEGDIRVASFNIHEYFNGDGRGGGFPAERGARSNEEFHRQTVGIVAAVEQIRPDVLALIEIENDGFGPDSAIESLRNALSESLGIAYSVAKPAEDRVGGDAIAVGILYSSVRIDPVGAARQLKGGVFEVQNRAPLAQVFRDRQTGATFLVVVNHLKSKSYCPESGPDIDHSDGQACWNAIRTTAAAELLDWVEYLLQESEVDRYVLLGDFNAYRKEDPTRLILDRGLVELVEQHSGLPQYSYVYRGMAGTLDYAFANSAFAENTVNAFIWHINAAYPWSANPSQPWLRSSDHDPVIVDFRPSQSATSD